MRVSTLMCGMAGKSVEDQQIETDSPTREQIKKDPKGNLLCLNRYRCSINLGMIVAGLILSDFSAIADSLAASLSLLNQLAL